MGEKLIELFTEAEENAADFCIDHHCEDCPARKFGMDCRKSLQADHLISNGVTFATDNKWIPVTERLPDKYQFVLAVCKNGKIFVGEYVDLGWRTLWRIRTARDSTKEITQIVTHWMYLPQPPKGE